MRKSIIGSAQLSYDIIPFSLLFYFPKLSPNTSIYQSQNEVNEKYFNGQGTLTGNFQITKYDKLKKRMSGKFNFTQTPGPNYSNMPTFEIKDGIFEDIQVR